MSNDKLKVEEVTDDTWTKENGFYETITIEERLFKLVSDNLFNLHQPFLQVGNIETVVCKQCGGTDFNVGQGEWLTVIKCKTCKWEQSIHEG